LTGRISTVLFVAVVCWIAPQLGDPRFQGIFNYIQEFQGYISPGILAAFVFGLLFKRAPAAAGVTALLVCVPVYGFLQWQFGHVAFLNRMAITFAVIVGLMALITAFKPLDHPRVMPVQANFDMTSSPIVHWFGMALIIVTISFYILFW